MTYGSLSDRAMIRLATASELEQMIDVVVDSGLFGAEESEPVRSMLSAYFAGSGTEGHGAVVDGDDDGLTGVAYYQPKPATEGVWDLTMLGVRGARQGAGRGAALLDWVEDDVRRKSGRMMVIETSAHANQARARRLYARAGYDEVVRIADYWEPGDDLVLFVKRLG
jgi:GNAT superfamily N-acetyltransferase